VVASGSRWSAMRWSNSVQMCGGCSSLLCALQFRSGGLRNVGGSRQWLHFSLFQRELMQVSDLVRSRSHVQADECVVVESSAMAAGAQG